MSNKLEFRIDGMHCAEEIALLKEELSPLVGEVERLSFDLLNGKLIVDTEGTKVSADDLMNYVSRTGMHAEIWSNAANVTAEHGFWQKYGRICLTSVSGLFGLLGFVVAVWLGGSFSAALGSAS